MSNSEFIVSESASQHRVAHRANLSERPKNPKADFTCRSWPSCLVGTLLKVSELLLFFVTAVSLCHTTTSAFELVLHDKNFPMSRRKKLSPSGPPFRVRAEFTPSAEMSRKFDPHSPIPLNFIPSHLGNIFESMSITGVLACFHSFATFASTAYLRMVQY